MHRRVGVCDGSCGNDKLFTGEETGRNIQPVNILFIETKKDDAAEWHLCGKERTVCTKESESGSCLVVSDS